MTVYLAFRPDSPNPFNEVLRILLADQGQPPLFAPTMIELLELAYSPPQPPPDELLSDEDDDE